MRSVDNCHVNKNRGNWFYFDYGALRTCSDLQIFRSAALLVLILVGLLEKSGEMLLDFEPFDDVDEVLPNQTRRFLLHAAQ